jgi:hypothetical protein
MTEITQPLVRQDDKDRTYEFMAATHLIAAAPGRFLKNTEFKDTLGGASYGLYERFAAKDAHDSVLSLLAVSITNASLDCLALAARIPESLPDREVNLRLGIKAAETVVTLLKALDDRHLEKVDKVSVGAVNIEAGGQAIVGSVHPTAPKSKE